RYAAAAALPVRSRLPATAGLDARLRAVEAICHRWLIAYSISILRVTVGAIFLGFGLLKFFPGVSPAQNLVESTTHILTFGLVPGAIALVGVATLESIIGLCLLANRGMRAAVYMLVVQLLGILSPIVLLPGRLFSGTGIAPTLEGQYVLKDIIIVGAALVLAATLGGARLHAATNDEDAG
ncbi:MAG TPA: DoxX family membrane protein, partial [Solirubrobacteraceae bacterium]|nr:DoxX family membrane protein [Solirubrobacteraceae bacterium]